MTTAIRRGISRLAFGCALLAGCTGSLEGHLPGFDSQTKSSGGTSSVDCPPATSGSGGASTDGGLIGEAGTGTVDAPFQALAPAAYLAKVKGLLTGLEVSQSELEEVTRDPAQLKALIATWQALPEYEMRMRDFFTMAFQQGDVTAEMVLNVTAYEQGPLDPRVLQNMRESFARTAMELVKEGQPFTSVLTTNRFMLTPALMMAMAWLDERQAGDGGFNSDALNDLLGPNAAYTVEGDTQIPIEQSTDPTNANYLKFYSPQLAAATGDCHNSFVVDKDNRLTLYTATLGETLMAFFMGNKQQRGFCVYPSGPGMLAASDFTTWRMMKIRQPNPGEKQTWMYELPKFRSGTELVLPKPRVGFYTTPAFLYTWQTNTSNQARVTANQTLIAAVGQAFDGVLGATPVSDIAVAKDHAKPGSDCYNCHIYMDPMRRYFRSTYSYYWDIQTDPNETKNPGVFAFNGRSHMGTGIADLGASLAADSHFATGWVHKLCTWANGAVCDPSGSNKTEPTDPEFLRITQAFKASNYSFNTLVQELFSSPLVTYAASTKSTENGVALSITKKAELCEIWDNRLGLADSCGLQALPSTSTGDPVKTIATVLPSDSYSRGQTVPTLANDPGLFFYSGVENICTALASRAVDTAAGMYQSKSSTSAIADMAHHLIGLLPPRDAGAIQILGDHYQAALSSGADASSALKSTFILACMSPTIVSVGQ